MVKTNAWEQCKLGEVLEEISIKSQIENEYKILSSTNTGIELRKGRVDGNSNIGYKILDIGEMVLSPQNLWLGNININNFIKGIVSPSYKTYKIKNINSNFLRVFLKSDKMMDEYKNVSTQGASIVRRSLEIEMFYNINIYLTNKEEQEKIGNFFKTFDDLITIHQRINIITNVIFLIIDFWNL